MNELRLFGMADNPGNFSDRAMLIFQEFRAKNSREVGSERTPNNHLFQAGTDDIELELHIVRRIRRISSYLFFEAGKKLRQAGMQLHLFSEFAKLGIGEFGKIAFADIPQHKVQVRTLIIEIDAIFFCRSNHLVFLLPERFSFYFVLAKECGLHIFCRKRQIKIEKNSKDVFQGHEMLGQGLLYKLLAAEKAEQRTVQNYLLFFFTIEQVFLSNQRAFICRRTVYAERAILNLAIEHRADVHGARLSHRAGIYRVRAVIFGYAFLSIQKSMIISKSLMQRTALGLSAGFINIFPADVHHFFQASRRA